VQYFWQDYRIKQDYKITDRTKDTEKKGGGRKGERRMENGQNKTSSDVIPACFWRESIKRLQHERAGLCFTCIPEIRMTASV
jgi:hypothetical protein